MLILLEDLRVVLEPAESVLDLDGATSVGSEVETFDVGLELAEDLCRVARVEDFVGIEICDLLDELFSLKIEQINFGLDLILKFLVICRNLVGHIFSDDLRIDLRTLTITF